MALELCGRTNIAGVGTVAGPAKRHAALAVALRVGPKGPVRAARDDAPAFLDFVPVSANLAV